MSAIGKINAALHNEDLPDDDLSVEEIIEFFHEQEALQTEE